MHNIEIITGLGCLRNLKCVSSNTPKVGRRHSPNKGPRWGVAESRPIFWEFGAAINPPHTKHDVHLELNTCAPWGHDGCVDHNMAMATPFGVKALYYAYSLVQKSCAPISMHKAGIKPPQSVRCILNSTFVDHETMMHVLIQCDGHHPFRCLGTFLRLLFRCKRTKHLWVYLRCLCT